MNRRTHSQIKKFLETSSHMLEAPESFLGDEPNTYTKEREWSEDHYKWAQIAAYAYTESMGNHTIPLIYMHINEHPDWLCDRVYALNSVREDKLFAKAGIPMFGIGSKRNICEFDVLGFSLNYSALFQNLIRMMQLSGIPAYAEERMKMNEPWPATIIGSNVFGQPMAVAPAFDMIWIGDLEDEYNEQGDNINPGINFFLDLTGSWIDSGDFDTASGREAYLRDVAQKCPWIFIPMFYKTTYTSISSSFSDIKRDVVESIVPTIPEAPLTVTKRYVQDMDSIAALTRPPISFYGAEGMGSGEIEASRSCTAKCTFSVSGDTLVTTDTGEQITIAEVAEQFDQDQTLKVLGVDPDTGKIRPTAIKKVITADCDQDHWLHFQLITGQELTITTDHKVLTTRNWIPAEECIPGDQVKLTTTASKNAVACLVGILLSPNHSAGSDGVVLYPGEADYKATHEILKDETPKGSVKGLGLQLTSLLANLIISRLYQDGLNLGQHGRTIDRAFAEDFIDENVLGYWAKFAGIKEGINLHIHTGRMYGLSINNLTERLNQLGYHPRIEPTSIGHVFKFDATASDKLTALSKKSWLDEETVVDGVGLISNILPSEERHTHWDIETETTNFFANGILISNCAAMYRYAPFRTRSVDFLVNAFAENAKNTGATSLSPLTLEWGTHPFKKKVTKLLLENVTDDFSAPSLRVDNVAEDSGFAALMRAGGKKQITLGVEGCSQRLRTSISKGLTEDEIVKACQNAIAAGMHRIKIYMISDLPGETDEDTLELIQLGERLDHLRRNYSKQKVQIRFSFTPLIRQGNTPMQWDQVDLERRKLGMVYSNLKHMGLDFTLGNKANKGARYYSQLFELADRVAGEALIETSLKLECFYFGVFPARAYDFLKEELEKRGRMFAQYWAQKEDDEVFEWDIIDILVSKKYLYSMYKAQNDHLMTGLDHSPNRLTQPGYSDVGHKCLDRCESAAGCKACSPTMLKRMMALKKGQDDAIQLSNVRIIDQTSYVQKVRMKVWIDPTHRYVRAGHWRTALRRATNLNNIKISKRHIKMSSDSIKFRSWTAGVEYVEMGLQKRLIRPSQVQEFKDKMNAYLDHMVIVSVQTIDKNVETFRAKSFIHLYKLEVAGTTHQKLEAELKECINNPTTTMVRIQAEQHQRQMKAEQVPWKSVVEHAWVELDGIRVVLWMSIKGDVSPYSILKTIHSARPQNEFVYPAIRLDTMLDTDKNIDDWLTKNCPTCTQQYPTGVDGNTVEFCANCRANGIIEGNQHSAELPGFFPDVVKAESIVTKAPLKMRKHRGGQIVDGVEDRRQSIELVI